MVLKKFLRSFGAGVLALQLLGSGESLAQTSDGAEPCRRIPPYPTKESPLEEYDEPIGQKLLEEKRAIDFYNNDGFLPQLPLRLERNIERKVFLENPRRFYFGQNVEKQDKAMQDIFKSSLKYLFENSYPFGTIRETIEDKLYFSKLGIRLGIADDKKIENGIYDLEDASEQKKPWKFRIGLGMNPYLGVKFDKAVSLRVYRDEVALEWKKRLFNGADLKIGATAPYSSFGNDIHGVARIQKIVGHNSFFSFGFRYGKHEDYSTGGVFERKDKNESYVGVSWAKFF